MAPPFSCIIDTMNVMLSAMFRCLPPCLCLLIACAPTATLYRGNRVPVQQSVNFTENRQGADRWETFDLAFDYRYQQLEDGLAISGQAAFSDHYRLLYGYVNLLQLYIFFLDEDSRVLETAKLTRSWTSSPDDVLSFDRLYHLPSGAVAFAFGYFGETSELGSVASFYHLPLSR